MDAYFRAIGFNSLSLSMDDIKKQVIENPDKRYILGSGVYDTYIELYKMYGEGIGVLIKGYMDVNDEITVDKIMPYAESEYNTQCARYMVDFIDNDPIIIYEDEKTGNELVFQLQDTSEFIKDETAFTQNGVEDKIIKKNKIVNVSGLSIYGTVILPVEKDEVDEELRQEEEAYFKGLVSRLKKGDNDAEDLLRLYAEETSSTIRERLEEEDFLSVVEGYFIPDEENELDYSILGDIEKISKTVNKVTDETVYKLLINITGTKIQLYINQRDLVGMPMKGMRFMGSCKLQGNVITAGI